MKTKNLIPMALLAMSGWSLPAGAGEPVAPPPPPVAQPSSDWQFLMTLPGWGAGLSGDIGVGGFKPISVDVGLEEIVDHLDMIAALTLEARHDRWGFILDGMYLKMSGDGETPGRLLDSVSLDVEEVLAEATVTYRLWEGNRGYLDLLAGARLISMDTTLHFDLDSAGVREVSEDLSNGIVDRVVSVIKDEVGEAEVRARAELEALNLEEQADALRGEVRTKAAEEILQNRAVAAIIRTLRDVTPAQRIFIQREVESSREIIAANKALAKAVVDERVATRVSSARNRAQQAVERARKKLAKSIESTIRRVIPEEVSDTEMWVDPIVGFRGRYNFTNKCYFAARADIGGFGISSDLTVNAFGALGYQWNKTFSTELGYRYLYVDYAHDGFVFDAATKGLFLGATFKF